MNYKIVECKPGTVEANHVLDMVCRAQLCGRSFAAAYKKPSKAKVDAYNDIAQFAIENNAYVTIIHAGVQRFTALVETDDAYYYFAQLCHKLRKMPSYADMLHQRVTCHEMNRRRT